MDLLKDYISEPYYTHKVEINKRYILSLIWNIFNDKKDNYKLVFRVRYILTDLNGERLSLKILNLRKPVIFKQIYVTDEIKNEIENNDKYTIIIKYFSDWLVTDFMDMLKSGNVDDFKMNLKIK